MQEIINKLDKPYPQFRLEKKVFWAVFLIFTSGVALSFALTDWQYFERSGSLIVIVGVLLALRDVNGKIDWFKGYTEFTISENISHLRNNNSGLLRSAINESIENDLTALSGEVQLILKKLKQRIRTVEASTLILGTFVWGYGSIIGDFVYAFA